MGKHWTAPQGLDVEGIILDNRPVLRVRQRGILVRYCRNILELQQVLARYGLGLEDLIEIPEDEP